MKLAIGSTKAGLALKKEVVRFLEEQDHTADDLGMKEGGDFVPYYASSARVAKAVSEGRYEKAILICGTGAGSVIVANKFRGVYAVHAGNEYEARRAATINNANVLCLGEWTTPPQHAAEIVRAWLSATFTQGFDPDWQKFLRDACEKIQRLEAENFQ